MANIVLIDEKKGRRSVSRQLLGTRHSVYEASDPGLVIEMVNGNFNSLKIDAIMINRQVAKIYEGDAITHFRATYPDVPLIVILDSPDTTLAIDYLEIGVKDILIKPIERKTLLNSLDKVDGRVVSK